MPSSVEASAATGTTARPSLASGAMCSSRFSLDRLTATTVAPASAAIRLTAVPMPPPPAPDTTTMRPASLRSSSILNCPDKIRYSAYCRTLFRSSNPLVKASDAAFATIVWTRRKLIPSEVVRYRAPNPTTADGWCVEHLTAPSRLFGANGLRTGPDGRVYVAQVTGSQISALDLATGVVEEVSAKGGDIIAPDDVAFGDDGTLFATEVMDGRVSARDTAGRTRVLRADL